jgi:hypothetical protein
MSERAAYTTFFIPLGKPISTAYMTVRRPLQAINAIPTNFVKNVLVIDLAYPPQFFPGIEEIYPDDEDDGVYSAVFNLWHERLPAWSAKDEILGRTAFWGELLYKLFMLLPIVAAFAYRWAIKSTAVLWLPLIWIVVQSRSRDIFVRLAVTVRSYWARVMLGYSLVVVVAFLMKLALLYGYWRLPSLSSLGQLGSAATMLADPVRLPLWQAASAFNATLAWAFCFHADKHLLARGTAEAWPEKWIKREYGAVTAIRWIITFYTIACTFYIVAAVAWNTQWPTFRLILFPWSE